MRAMKTAIIALACVLYAAATSYAGEVSHGSLKVIDAWTKATVGKNGAAYVTVMNHGDAMDRLIAVETAVANKAEIHTHLMEDGVMKMRRIKAVELHPGAPAVLEPGGDHIMLFGVKKKWVADEMMPLTLVFENAGKVDVMVQVHAWGSSKPAKKKMDHKGHDTKKHNHGS